MVLLYSNSQWIRIWIVDCIHSCFLVVSCCPGIRSDGLDDNRIQKRYTPGGLHFREKGLCPYAVDVFYFHDTDNF